MIAAGYALYGSATVIVLSFGDAPSMFMLGMLYKYYPHFEILLKIRTLVSSF